MTENQSVSSLQNECSKQRGPESTVNQLKHCHTYAIQKNSTRVWSQAEYNTSPHAVLVSLPRLRVVFLFFNIALMTVL